MKAIALTVLMALCFSAPVLAFEKHSAVAPDTGSRGGTAAPEVSNLPDSLQWAVLWAYFLTQNPNPTTIDLAKGVRFVESQMKRNNK